MLVLVVSWMAKHGKEAETREILRKLAAEARKEPGCLGFLVHQHSDDPRRFLLYEQYHGREGYEAHMATEPFKENILGKVVPMLESRVRDFMSTVEPA